jgi:hypothetical protein
MPSFFMTISGRQKPVKPLCRRLRPAKAVSQNQFGLTQTPSASEARMTVPAKLRMMRSVFMKFLS